MCRGLIKYGDVASGISAVVIGEKDLGYSLEKLGVSNPDPFIKRAAAEYPEIPVNPAKYMLLRSRAVSSLEGHGPNNNQDAWEWEDLCLRYRTFVGAPACVNHQNTDPKKFFGLEPDAYLTHTAEGGYVECLQAYDKDKLEKAYPGLVEKVRNGDITDVSMGCYVAYSICSLCGHEAAQPKDFCYHIKSKYSGYYDPDVYEINKDFVFFELSLIENSLGADDDAKILTYYFNDPHPDVGEKVAFLEKVAKQGTVAEKMWALEEVDRIRTRLASVRRGA